MNSGTCFLFISVVMMMSLGVFPGYKSALRMLSNVGVIRHHGLLGVGIDIHFCQYTD